MTRELGPLTVHLAAVLAQEVAALRAEVLSLRPRAFGAGGGGGGGCPVLLLSSGPVERLDTAKGFVYFDQVVDVVGGLEGGHATLGDLYGLAAHRAGQVLPAPGRGPLQAGQAEHVQAARNSLRLKEGLEADGARDHLGDLLDGHLGYHPGARRAWRARPGHGVGEWGRRHWGLCQKSPGSRTFPYT